MKRPLVLLTLTFCCGIFAGEKTALPFWVIFHISLIAIICSYFFRKKLLVCDLMLCGLIFLIGALSFEGTEILSANDISRFIYYGNKNLCTVKGEIVSQPRQKYSGRSFFIASRELVIGNRKIDCQGRLIVYFRGNQPINIMVIFATTWSSLAGITMAVWYDLAGSAPAR